MKKRLNLILNGKGGVGKSFFAVNFVQYLKDRGIANVACDCDNENSTLKRFHPEAEFLDLASSRSLDAMFHALGKADVVVVDCRAASSELFFDYFSEIDLSTTLTALGAAATVIMPVNHELDSVDQIQRVAERIRDIASYVVLRNAVHCDSFSLYDQSVIRKRLRKDFGAKEIAMNRLQPWLVEALNLNSLPITAAVSGQQFHLLDRQRLLTWQRRLYEQIDGAADLLLPGTTNEAPAK
jgi:cellulose biosynthesis protein BcsQ